VNIPQLKPRSKKFGNNNNNDDDDDDDDDNNNNNNNNNNNILSSLPNFFTSIPHPSEFQSKLIISNENIFSLSLPSCY
jgi:hypothetical protein